ncbi:hypothetical protein F5887DRAFT_899142 [Amanita rubescens]|nr:hypothetical protein F5887DRAFT_899142 [Amanita rubescens]
MELRTTHLLLDKDGVVIGVLLGMPKDQEGWKEAQDEAHRILRDGADKISARAKNTTHRRGTFPSLAHGISFGGGQKVPQFLKHASKTVAAVLDGFVQSDAIQRICKYASCKRQAIKARQDGGPDEQHSLRCDYDDRIGAFPCRSFNVGRQSVTFPHTDNCNLAHSWCSVTPVGNFDHRTGGQLVLWDFGLVVDFPAGCTILIPSSVIVHSNTGIKDHEERFSIVQYAAGGLFRWVENGFSTQDCKVEMDCERWANSVKMFMNVEELVDPAV